MLEPGARGCDDALSEYGRPLMLLMGEVALALLMACGNAADLLMARASARRHEIGIRLSPGASAAVSSGNYSGRACCSLLGGSAGLLLSL